MFIVASARKLPSARRARRQSTRPKSEPSVSVSMMQWVLGPCRLNLPGQQAVRHPPPRPLGTARRLRTSRSALEPRDDEPFPAPVDRHQHPPEPRADDEANAPPTSSPGRKSVGSSSSCQYTGPAYSRSHPDNEPDTGNTTFGRLTWRADSPGIPTSLGGRSVGPPDKRCRSTSGRTI
jgi:hypothetical protein